MLKNCVERCCELKRAIPCLGLLETGAGERTHMVATAKMKGAAGNSCRTMLQNGEDSFQVDLRIQGVSQDAIYKDMDWMTRIQTLVDKLQAV